MDYMLVYYEEDFTSIAYMDSDFQSDPNFRKAKSSSIFTHSRLVIILRNVKQSCIVDFSMEAEYVVTCEVAKAVVWLSKFLMDL